MSKSHKNTEKSIEIVIVIGCNTGVSSGRVRKHDSCQRTRSTLIAPIILYGSNNIGQHGPCQLTRLGRVSHGYFVW